MDIVHKAFQNFICSFIYLFNLFIKNNFGLGFFKIVNVFKQLLIVTDHCNKVLYILLMHIYLVCVAVDNCRASVFTPVQLPTCVFTFVYDSARRSKGSYHSSYFHLCQKQKGFHLNSLLFLRCFSIHLKLEPIRLLVS